MIASLLSAIGAAVGNILLYLFAGFLIALVAAGVYLLWCQIWRLEVG